MNAKGTGAGSRVKDERGGRHRFRRAVARYGIGAASVALALVIAAGLQSLLLAVSAGPGSDNRLTLMLASGLQSLLLSRTILAVFIVAVTISALYGGVGPAVFATLLSVVIDGLVLLKPMPSSAYPEEETVLGLFIVSSLLITLIAAQRTRAEAALQESAARTRAIVDTAVDGIITIDEHGVIDSANPAAERLFGYPCTEMIGRNVSLLMPSPYRESHDQYIANYLRTGEGKVLGIGREVVGRRRDGTTFPIDLSLSEVVLNNRRLFTGIVRDISERKQADEQRADALQRERQAREEAEEANRAKDEFLAVISHELRTPLTPILTWSRLLRSGKLDHAATDRALEAIERATRSQAQLIEDLLDVSRITSGKLRLEVRPIELPSVIEAAIESVRPGAEAKGIRLEVVLDRNAGMVSGDPERLQQVVWNLLSNAVKFTPRAGRIEVRLQRVDSRVGIAVSDTGQGIDPQFLPHVFERFRQADSSSTRAHGGLGLGLAIVRHLVELHGGWVRAESPGEGKGATFVVELPLAILHQPVTSDRIPPCAGEGVPFVAKPTLGGARILLVDDEPDTVETLRIVLEQAGAEIRTATSAGDALAALAEWRADVLVCDIGMPEEDGYALIRKVRALAPERGGYIPAVALTAYARVEDRLKVLSSGFQMHVPKPVEPAELVAVMAAMKDWAGKNTFH